MKHTIADARSGYDEIELLIEMDRHGMTVELPDGAIITLDLSGGVLSAYLQQPDEENQELFLAWRVRGINQHKKGGAH